jgi:hypothetical protein
MAGQQARIWMLLIDKFYLAIVDIIPGVNAWGFLA